MLLGDLTVSDLERAINDRHRLNFSGRAGAAVRDLALASGQRVVLAPTVVASARSVQAFSVTLGMVIKQAQAEGLVSSGMWQAVRPLKVHDASISDVRQVPSIPEVFDLAEAISGRGVTDRGTGLARGARLRAAVLLCGTSALRPGEATGLRTADVHLDSARPFVVLRQTMRRLTVAQAAFPGPDTVVDEHRWAHRPLKHRTPGTTRRVPLHPRAVPYIREHLDRFAGPELFLSSSTGTGPLDWSNVEDAYWRPACEAVMRGERSFLGAMPPKMLRKAAITDMLARGISVYVAAAIAGHSPEVLLKHYAGVVNQSDLLDIWEEAM
jgi:integrase